MSSMKDFCLHSVDLEANFQYIHFEASKNILGLVNCAAGKCDVISIHKSTNYFFLMSNNETVNVVEKHSTRNIVK